MATISLVIPNPVVSRVVDALADRGGWDGTGDKTAFAKSVVIDYVMSVTRNYEADRDAAIAKAAATTKVASEIAIS